MAEKHFRDLNTFVPFAVTSVVCPGFPGDSKLFVGGVFVLFVCFIKKQSLESDAMMDWNNLNYIGNQEMCQLVMYNFYSVTMQDFKL